MQSEFVWSVAFVIGDVFVFELPEIRALRRAGESQSRAVDQR